MTFKKHIPSYIITDGYRALTSYDGQPLTCGCGDTEHMYHACPKHGAAKTTALATVDHTWANIVAATASVDVPSPSDGPNMDTDRGAQAVEMRSSDTRNGQSKPHLSLQDGSLFVTHFPVTQPLPPTRPVVTLPP